MFLTVRKVLASNSLTTILKTVSECGFTSQRSMSRWSVYHRRSRLYSLFGVSSCAVVGAVLLHRALLPYDDKFSQIQTVHAVSANDEDRTNGSRMRGQWNFIADVVDKAAPAVVYIEIQGRNPFTGQKIPISNGSGFIVRSDGLILTNAHVVGNNRSVRVQLHDGRSFVGQVQAVDPVSDLATVIIPAQNLPVLQLGDSSTLRPGEWVIAMGSPYRLSNTVTAGIVSSTQRHSKELGMLGRDIDYIQTDANINFGNSGGPLISLDCEAIGINTMKVDAGISFAIPSDYAKKFLEKAASVEKRTGARSWLGVPARRYIGITMLSLTPELISELQARQPNFPDVDQGVLVYRVASDSPAQSAGIVAGDVITKINGVELTSSTDLYASIAKADNLELTIRRRGFPTPLTVTVKPDIVD